MKDQRKPNGYELRKARETRNVTILMVSTAIILCAIYVYISMPQSSQQRDFGGSESDIESYIRSKASSQPVASGYEPVALYYKSAGMAHEKFCCIGTITRNRDYGTIVITAEHVFRTDLSEAQQISIRPIHKSVNEQIQYLDHIVKTGEQLNNQDIVIVSVGTTPKMFDPFSKYIYQEVSQNFYGSVTVQGSEVYSMRSLVSGERVRTLGYARRGQSTNDSIFVLIEYHAQRGESGTGFIDDNGGLWVLHASPDTGQEQLILEEYERLTHKHALAVATVSGPFGGKYSNH